MPDTAQPDLEQKAIKSGRTFILIVAIVFTIVPTFLLFLGNRTWKVINRFAWQKVPCEILSATVERTSANTWYPYEPKIKYRYVLNGAAFESESVGEAHYALYDEADAIARQTLQNKNYCYIGGEPRQTVLFRFSSDHRFDLLFNAAFVSFAILLFVAQFFIRTLDGLRLLRRAVFSFIFLLVGGVAFASSVTMIKAIWKSSRATKWPQVPCTIIFSDFQTDRSNGKTIYRPDLLYRYQSSGRSFISSRVDFIQEGAGKPDRALLAKFPEGARRALLCKSARRR